MLRIIPFTTLLISSIFFASCESNFFRAEIRNNSADTVQVDYVLIESDDNLYIGGGPNIRPDTGLGSYQEKYDSITKTHTFFIPPNRICHLARTMNEDFNLISKKVFFKRLDIIKRNDTLITAKNQGTKLIFDREQTTHEVTWGLTIE